MADHGFTTTFAVGRTRRKSSWLVVGNYFNFTEDETVSA